jgi:hypothetical protein
MTRQEPNQISQDQAPEPASNLWATLLRVAWLAIVLGLVLETFLLVLGGTLGEALGLRPLVADLVKNISWSVFVCVGLAIGTTVAQARVPVMGLLGLLSAPLAFEVSRVFHKGALEALAVAEGGGDDLSPLLVAVIRGLEYGCLGLGIGWVSQRRWGGAAAHAAVGLSVGLLFGVTEIALAPGTIAQLPTVDLVTEGVNEVLFPVGCSMVLFSAKALGEKATNQDRARPRNRGRGARPGHRPR